MSGPSAKELARAELARGEREAAAASARRAVAADPGDAQAWTLLGVCLEAVEPAQALAAWQKAIALAPHDAEPYFRLGDFERRRGRHDAGRRRLPRRARHRLRASGAVEQPRPRAAGAGPLRRSDRRLRSGDADAARHGAGARQPGRCPARAAPYRRGDRLLPARLRARAQRVAPVGQPRRLPAPYRRARRCAARASSAPWRWNPTCPTRWSTSPPA